MQPFTLSIETTEGESFQHGFHLGTDESVARAIIEDKSKNYIANDMHVITMALMREGKIVDVFYGDRWHNDGETK